MSSLDSNDFVEMLNDEGYNIDLIKDETWSKIDDFLDEQCSLVISDASKEIFEETLKYFKIEKEAKEDET